RQRRGQRGGGERAARFRRCTMADRARQARRRWFCQPPAVRRGRRSARRAAWRANRAGFRLSAEAWQPPAQYALATANSTASIRADLTSLLAKPPIASIARWP